MLARELPRRPEPEEEEARVKPWRQEEPCFERGCGGGGGYGFAAGGGGGGGGGGTDGGGES